MFGTLLSTLLKSKWTWIAIGVITLGIWVYSLYAQNQQLQAEKRALQQNTAFVADSLNKKVDSLQTIAVKVGDIQSKATEWKNKYLAVSTKYQISLDTISILKKRVDSVQVVGDTVTVPFEGTQGIASYKGQTEANIRTKQGTHSIRIAFSEVETQSVLFYDETAKLWKIRTLSLSPGVKLRGLSTVDDETYRKISSIAQIQDKTPSTFGVGGLFTSDRVYGGLTLSPSRWSFGLYYKVFEKQNLQSQSWSDKILVGVTYYIW